MVLTARFNPASSVSFDFLASLPGSRGTKAFSDSLQVSISCHNRFLLSRPLVRVGCFSLAVDKQSSS